MANQKPTRTNSNSSSAKAVAASETAVSKPATAPATPAPVAATPVSAAVPAPKTIPVQAVAPAAIAPAPVAAPATTQLIAKLHHIDADMARDAAATLGTLPANSDSIAALSAVLLNANHFFHPVVRAAAAHALGQLRDARGFEALLHATRDSMAETSDEAVKALGRLGDKRAMSTLQAIIKNADGFYLENVRRSAEAALKQLTA